MRIQVMEDPDVRGKMAYLLVEFDDDIADKMAKEGLRAAPIITLNGERFHVAYYDELRMHYVPMDRSSSLQLVLSRSR